MHIMLCNFLCMSLKEHKRLSWCQQVKKVRQRLVRDHGDKSIVKVVAETNRTRVVLI